MTYCSACGHKWTGKTTCHCSSCHESFTGVTVFDRHQTLTDGHPGFACHEPAAVGLVYDSGARGGGAWRGQPPSGGEGAAHWSDAAVPADGGVS